MKETILGVNQQLALKERLDLIDIMLLSIVKDKMDSPQNRKVEHDGKTFVWVVYQNVIDYLPILGLKKRRLAARLDDLCRKNLLEKYFDQTNGSYTYFRLGEKDMAVAPKAKDCRPANKGGVTGVANKEKPYNKIPTKEKEKENNKLFSKKKADDPADYDLLFDRFKAKALGDVDLRRALKDYRITDMEALLEEFKSHVVDCFKVDEFTDNGYIRNRQWLLNSISRLDITKATGITLGIGEYMQSGRRYYVFHGEKREVPTDAPPRQLKDQVWYTTEKRWGPDV